MADLVVVLFWQTMATLMESPRFKKPLDFLKVLITRHTGSAEAKQTEAMIRLAFGGHVIESVMLQTVEIERPAMTLARCTKFNNLAAPPKPSAAPSRRWKLSMAN